jgi:hypothetical protein
MSLGLAKPPGKDLLVSHGLKNWQYTWEQKETPCQKLNPGHAALKSVTTQLSKALVLELNATS